MNAKTPHIVGLGHSFQREMKALGIAAPVKKAAAGSAGTGRCVVLVTPDGERTMSTYLGAASTLSPADVTGTIPQSFDILFVEGYLWDAPQGAAVIEYAAQKAKAAGARVALTPSDAGCVVRNEAVMRDFIGRYVDILVGNCSEIG